MLSFQPWIPACAGMTLDGEHRPRHSEGPSVSRHTGIDPTDALGARRDEGRGLAAPSFPIDRPRA